MTRFVRFIFCLMICVLSAGCDHSQEKVVVYCALDRMYSEQIFQNFEDLTNISVNIVYDTELTKTVGLVNRIIAESDNPQCDVFWNNEISRTIVLKERLLLEPYRSPSVNDIPTHFKDPDGYWSGFAARCRIIIYNKTKFKDTSPPNSVLELVNPEWKGKAAIAYPLLGTTATHAAVLFSKYGDKWALDFFRKLKQNEIGVLDGNATVRDQVVSGEYWWGLTDTDDANGAIVDGKNVDIIYPDQSSDEMGTLIIPNTVALVNGAPNKSNAQKLIDYILSADVETKLAFSRSAQIPLREGIHHPENVKTLDHFKVLDVDFEKASKEIERTSNILSNLFVR